MANLLPLPPSGVQIFDVQTGYLTIQGQNYFNALNQFLASISGAPADAEYWVSQADASLTNEVNIGTLASGYLKSTQAAGIATPSTVTAIPGTDITGAALSKTDDTNVTLTLTGTPTTALLRAANVAAGWTGKLGLARGGTNADLSATGGTGQVLQQASVGAAITVGTISGGSITGAALTRTSDTNVTLTLGGAPSTALLNAASITAGWSGQLGLSRGGTNADLSATGGTNQVLQQSSSGAAITVGALAGVAIANRNTADGSVSGTLLTDLSNLTVTLASSTNYIYQAYLPITADTTGGLQLALAGTVTLNSIRLGVVGNSFSASTTPIVNTQWTNATVASNSLSTSPGTNSNSMYVLIQGALSVNAGGTLKLQFAQNVNNGTSTVLRNAWITLTQTTN